jgi:succinoglycan biosynthesis transport protein ExoP
VTRVTPTGECQYWHLGNRMLLIYGWLGRRSTPHEKWNSLMLLTQKAPFVLSREERPEANAPASLLLANLGFARRQLSLILASLAFASCVGILYLLVTRPTYTASATMVIDSRRGGVQQKSVLGDPPADSAWIDSQIGILMLERDKIGLVVAQQLELAKKPGLYEKDEGFLGTLITAVTGLFGNNPPAKTASEEELTQRAAGEVAGGLDVKRIGFSYLVDINFSSHNQELAAKVANAAADAYVVAELNAKYQSLRQASDWLQERYQTLRDQASSADRAVVEFKNKNNIVTASGKPIIDLQLTEVNNRIGEARALTADKQARLDQIQAVIKDQEANGTIDTTVPDALLNPIITKLRGQYLDLVNKEADWSKRYGHNHLLVVTLRDQIKDIRNSTREELKRIAESDRSELEIAKKKEEELTKQLAGIIAQVPNDAQITLRGLESSAQSFRTFYDNFLQNYTESVQQQSSPIPETRVVAYAPAASKSLPSTPRVVLFTIFGGVAFGIGLGALREALDRSFRTARQVREALQTECITLVPRLKKRTGPSSTRTLIGALKKKRVIDPNEVILRLRNESPFSRFAESIRALKLALDLGDSGLAAKVIGFTSSVPQEGKSTVAASLAAYMAQVGVRVILVDCDLRCPALSRSLAPHANYGIIDVLSGRLSLEETIWKDSASELAFLPAGEVSRMPNTSQVLQGAPMNDLFDVLRTRYEYIIVDLSPLAPVVDARATTRLVDFYVLLLEWGQTDIEVVQQTLKEAQGVYNNLLGVVLNKVDMNVIGRYDSYHSQSNRNKYNKYFHHGEIRYEAPTPQ